MAPWGQYLKCRLATMLLNNTNLTRQAAKKTGKQDRVLSQTDVLIKKLIMSYGVLQGHTVYLY